MPLVKVETNYCNNNPLTLDVKQLNKIIKVYHFHTLKTLWDLARIKLWCIMGIPGSKSSSHQENGLLSLNALVDDKPTTYYVNIYLIVQSQQYKPKKNVWLMFKSCTLYKLLKGVFWILKDIYDTVFRKNS